MKLTQYMRGEESDTEREIPDDDVEGFLRDRLGFHLSDCWEEGEVRSQYFEHHEVKPGRALAPCIIVLRVRDVFTATLYEYPCASGRHMRERLASMSRSLTPPAYIEELKKLESVTNDYLSLYTIWGGRITGTQVQTLPEAKPALLQQARAMLVELRNGATLSREWEPFAVRLVQSPLQEKAGILVFELIQEGFCERFDLFLPGNDVYLQEAGLFGVFNGSWFNAQYKASLSEMSVEEYGFHSPPLHGEEAHQIARRILANRPAITTVLPLHSNDPSLCTQFIQFALHFALALLN